MDRILVIDDDDMVAHLLQKHLTNEGYHVTRSNLAKAGFEMALKNPPHLILLDVNLPDATGFQMCAKFRKHDITKAIPIIMLSGAARFPNQKKIGLDFGANDYILKPFDILEMTVKIHNLIHPNNRIETLPQPDSAPEPAPERESEPVPPIIKEIEMPPIQEPVQPVARPKIVPFPIPQTPVHDKNDESVAPFLEFSADIVTLVSRLPQTHAGRLAADSLYKSGASVALFMQEAGHTESKEESYHPLALAHQGLHESAYWLTLIHKSKITEDPMVETLEKKCHELTALLMKRLATAPRRVVKGLNSSWD